MSHSATVLNVLIASPSDVLNERETIAQALYAWNSLHSVEKRIVLLPIRWESHSAPAMGDRPQGIINEQVVKTCDVLIGAFWTRLGSSTGIEESGTVEEIKWFLKQKRPVMLYFSDAAIPQDRLDLSQIERLRTFRESIKDKGVQENYSSCQDLREKLLRHLTIIMRDMSVGPSVPQKTVIEANLAAQASSTTDQGIHLKNYTEKAFIVTGDTRSFKEGLHNAGGKWMKTKGGFFAWMFSKRRLREVAATLGVEPTLED
ncbi:MAG: hypothetical protein QOF41_152 [Methylobacteriaceae bacterium]|nr:hypothetical protein [Methylobacteriaceae bacterium]